jgi:hypothetical protein
MKLLTKELEDQMLANGQFNSIQTARGEDNKDFQPVVKFFCPWNRATWLLTELDPEDPDLAFGLCDLGMGCPELGSVRLSEMTEVRGPFGLTIERDRHFQPSMTLSAYAEAAKRAGCISA